GAPAEDHARRPAAHPVRPVTIAGQRSRRRHALMRNYRLLGQARDHFDWWLFVGTALLALIGVVNLYSATSVSKDALREIYVQQVYWLVFGGLIATLVAAVDYRHYERLGYGLYGLGVILL